MSQPIYSLSHSVTLPSLSSSQIAHLGQNMSTLNLNNLNSLGSNTISIGGLGNVMGYGSRIINMHPDVKKYEIYETPIDVLTLSVAWKRLRDAGTSAGKIGSLLDKDLFELTTSDDHVRAEAVRDYYSKKVVMWKLKGDRLTAYREDMNSFVHGDGKKFRENMLGIAYYLPTFYEYDIQLDEVRMRVISKITHKPTMRDSKILQPLKRIVFKNKRTSNIQYWLQYTKTEGAVLITIDTKNPLDHLWKHIFETSLNINVTGLFLTKHRDNFEYFSVNNWNLT